MQLTLLLHNIRSTHNVGSIFRSADGFGVQRIILSGYTPYPITADDSRPPHIRKKIHAQIAKTALGAEASVPFMVVADPAEVVRQHKQAGFTIAALEQTPGALMLPSYHPPQKLLLILGEEVAGVPADLLNQCDVHLEIPMAGRKESFNVSVAAGIALYALTT